MWRAICRCVNASLEVHGQYEVTYGSDGVTRSRFIGCALSLIVKDRGVQGCVIAPVLFNILFDCVVRLALSEMPEGCGVDVYPRCWVLL